MSSGASYSNIKLKRLIPFSEKVFFNTNVKDISPNKGVEPNINYFFDGRTLTDLKANNKRIYIVDEVYLSEEEVVNRFTNVNGISVAIFNKEFTEDDQSIRIIETDLISKFIGTYTLPNVGFNSSLFKANTSYIYISNDIIGVANKFSDIKTFGMTKISLYESRCRLLDFSEQEEYTQIKNAAFSVINSTLEPDVFNPDVVEKYIPYLFRKDNSGKKLFIVQEKTAVNKPSKLENYIDFYGHDTLLEFESDPVINVEIDSVEFTSNMSDSEISNTVKSAISVNDNNNFDWPDTTSLYSYDFKLEGITDLKGVKRFYYIHPFSPDYLFFYEGRLITDPELVCLSLGNNKAVLRNLKVNYALFPLSYMLSNLVCVKPARTQFKYDFENDSFSFFDKEGMFEDTVRSYCVYTTNAYKNFNRKDIEYLATLDKTNTIFLDERGLLRLPSNRPLDVCLKLSYFGDDKHIMFSLPNRNAAVISNSAEFLDITNTQLVNLLDRGIIILPKNYLLVFVNEKLLSPKNLINLGNDMYLIDASYYGSKIENVRVFINNKHLLGRIIKSKFLNDIQLNKISIFVQNFVNLYPVRPTDIEYSLYKNRTFYPADNLLGQYDRLARVLSSDFLDAVIDLPDDDPRVEKILNSFTSSFKDITSSALKQVPDNVQDDRIVLPSGSGRSRYNAHI